MELVKKGELPTRLRDSYMPTFAESLELQESKPRRVKQDPDIKDSPGTEPAKYYAKDAKGKEMSVATKKARDRHFAKGAAKDDDDPSAYKPAPGDKGAKTKLSKHTKKVRKMFPSLYEAPPDTSDAMKRYKAGKAGFTDIAHLKAKGLIKRADGTKRKSDKYKEDVSQDESLWANIHKKRQRIKRGSGERMRKPGEKGAPTPAQMKRAKGEERELNEWGDRGSSRISRKEGYTEQTFLYT